MTDQQTSRTNITEALGRQVLERHVQATICGADMPFDPNDRSCGFYEHDPIHDLYADESKRAKLPPLLTEDQRHEYVPVGRGICAADEDDWPCSAYRLALAAEPRSDAVTAPDEPSLCACGQGCVLPHQHFPMPATPDEPSTSAKQIDEDADWLIRHLRCEWGIRTPDECNRINDPCVPCALRLWLDGIPALSEDARRAIAASEARAAHLNPADSGSSASVPPLERAALIAEEHAERLKHTTHYDGLGMGWLAGEELCREIARRIRAYAAETPAQGRGDESR